MPTNASADYALFTSRNIGFIPVELQERIRQTRVLVAGCGLGGVIAEVAIRTGFLNLGLIDGDWVEHHNLNRQNFVAQDVGKFKAESLAARLRDVNPEAVVRNFNVMLDSENVEELVSQYDIIIDTIDFRSPAAIRALHAEANKQGKTVIASLSVGWGGAALVFTPQGPTLSDLLGASSFNNEPAAYVEAFARMMQSYSKVFPEYAFRVLSKVLNSKEICPFSQIGPGTFAAASLTVLLAVRLLAGDDVPQAPELILVDPMGCPIVCAPDA
jgi:molybdopterin/thiamine biosynthesis adenylyltransferase